MRETAIVAAAWSLVGGPGVQLFVPRASGRRRRRRAARGGSRARRGRRPAKTRSKCCASRPGSRASGAELGPDALPAELHLVERAVSFTKGCFTGQEVVTRMHSRGRVGHLLVGIALGERATLPAVGAAVELGGARVGELTSVARSPEAGAIALAVVRKGSESRVRKLAIEGRERARRQPAVRRDSGDVP